MPGIVTPTQIPPSDEEIAQAVEVLSRLSRGFLPFELFIQVARLVTTPTVDFAPVRKTEQGEVEIFLTQREPDDLYWPNEWHVPGGVLRSTDDEGDFSSGYSRTMDGELGGGLVAIGEPQFVAMKFWDGLRGRELEIVHYVEVEVKPGVSLPGAFFDVTKLPENTIKQQLSVIAEVAAAYRAAGIDK